MGTPLLRAATARDRLKSWLIDDAYPLWWEKGGDHANGGFWERLAQDGTPQDLPRRARVLPRQIYAYAVAPELGWRGPATTAVDQGVAWYLRHFRRPDGLFRTLVAKDGTALDEGAALYDQAFGLFCLAVASQLTQRLDLQTLALETLDVLQRTRTHPIAGFEEMVPRVLPLGSNPHMHMFEACLAWEEMGGVAAWTVLADSIAELALARFIDAKSGALREFFDGDWNPVAGTDGRIVEPGHQFEWGWLLLRWGRLRQRPAKSMASTGNAVWRSMPCSTTFRSTIRSPACGRRPNGSRRPACPPS
jgi:mannose-6-phosphate isomerase